MYPSWGNYGGPQSQNYGGPGPRKQQGAGLPAPAAGYGGFEASSSGTMFSSLQEQHLQQMQQLQMLHQKQLQSVLHHGNSGSAYGGGYSGPSSWHSDTSGQMDSGAGAQPYYKQHDETMARGPPVPKQAHHQPPPPPIQPHSTEPQPCPPPSEPLSSKLQENSSAPKAPEVSKKDPSTTEEDKALPLQVQLYF